MYVIVRKSECKKLPFLLRWVNVAEKQQKNKPQASRINHASIYFTLFYFSVTLKLESHFLHGEVFAVFFFFQLLWSIHGYTQPLCFSSAHDAYCCLFFLHFFPSPSLPVSFHIYFELVLQLLYASLQILPSAVKKESWLSWTSIAKGCLHYS